MKLRLKLAALASATALVSGVAVAAAGPALATNGAILCVTDLQGYPQCAHEYNGVLEINTDAASDTFDVPNVQGRITDKTSGQCVNVDNKSSISMDACDTSSSEQFIEEAGPSGTAQFVSVTEPTECLNDKYYAGIVNVTTCSYGNPDQDWTI
jgi:hypothetical protein